MTTDIDIARAAPKRPIAAVAEGLGIPDDAVIPYGRFMAKLDAGFVAGLAPRPDARLVLVTAISPTPAGEGKTTTTIGLGDGLSRMGKRTAICLREPSLGPCFGQKGGATGGGRAQVVPMENINLHFTGDFHAITSAHNLLAAVLDNHIHWGNGLGIDLRRIAWRRALDMNDRALRATVSSLGGVANGFPREDGFDITVASEVMAVFCLAWDMDDLEARLGRMVVAATGAGRPVAARDLGVVGAMAVLLKDALLPNLVQTIEGTPALVHGGPFANIAHGCNSVIATRTALGLADYVVTEAGFGADLGAEKFFNIKCRSAALKPAAVVIVATIRALKMHGGVPKGDLATEDLPALERGFANLERHVGNLRGFGFDPLVAINHFDADTPAEEAHLRELCGARLQTDAILCRHWAQGSAGIGDLAAAVVERAAHPGELRLTYPNDMPLADKMRTVARRIYGADDIALTETARKQIAALEQIDRHRLPICFAKTQYSFSADPSRMGAPSGFDLPIQSVRHMAGAGFVVALCGDIRTMPGLPRHPAALDMGLIDGLVHGLS
jgi:formate--tetrahydrofolate ligase